MAANQPSSSEQRLPCATCPNQPSCAEYGGCQLRNDPPGEASSESVDFSGLQGAVDTACKTIDDLRERLQDARQALVEQAHEIAELKAARSATSRGSGMTKNGWVPVTQCEPDISNPAVYFPKGRLGQECVATIEWPGYWDKNCLPFTHWRPVESLRPSESRTKP